MRWRRSIRTGRRNPPDGNLQRQTAGPFVSSGEWRRRTLITEPLVNSCMPVPGYDPDDLESALREAIESRDDGFLTPDQRDRYEQGEQLQEILDADNINALLD